MVLGKFGRRTTLFDPRFATAELSSARAALDRGDWEPALELMQAPGDLSMVVTGLTLGKTPIDHYKQLTTDQPGVASYTLLAARRIKGAWAIRGSDRAAKVSETAMKNFHKQLVLASEAGQQALVLGPPSADAHAALAHLGRGLQQRLPHIESHFERAHAVVPFHDAAASAMLQASCAKWSGSHEAMFSFARRLADEAPASASVQWAIPAAHWEYWASVAEHGMPREDYFSQTDVHEEIQSSALRFLDATPSEPAGPQLLLALNWFVFGLASSKSRPKSTISECARRINGRVTEWPWEGTFIGDRRKHYRAMLNRGKPSVLAEGRAVAAEL